MNSFSFVRFKNFYTILYITPKVNLFKNQFIKWGVYQLYFLLFYIQQLINWRNRIMKYNHAEWTRNMEEAQKGIADVQQGLAELIRLNEETTNHYDEILSEILSLINNFKGDE